jgi:site-specific recombinase XerD
MDPRLLLEDWIATSVLRPSTQLAYRRDVTSWLNWCERTRTDPYAFGIEHVARWAYDRYLREVLGSRPFNDPADLAWIAENHPAVAKSHDRRISSLTGFYEAARDRGCIRIPPDLTELRSGLDRDGQAPQRLLPEERDAFLTAIGSWGPDNSRNHHRDQLIAHLLLEGIRPGRIVLLDIRHLYEMTTSTGIPYYEARAPDDHENVGKPYVLGLLASAAVRAYLPKRRKPADGVHALIIGEGGQGLTSDYPNKIVQSIAATSILAGREPPVTADAVAHTGSWNTPDPG